MKNKKKFQKGIDIIIQIWFNRRILSGLKNTNFNRIAIQRASRPRQLAGFLLGIKRGKVDGFIKIHRKIIDTSIYLDSEAVHLFLHLLLKASFKERKIIFDKQFVDLKRGQFITGRKKLALETGISESKIYRLLDIFKSDNLIEQQTNSRYSIISIVNWDEYQEIEQPTNSRRTADEQPTNTNNKDKKDNKDNNVSYAKKTDPFINPYKTFFEAEYEKIFGQRPYLLKAHCEKLCEISEGLEDFKGIIPEVLKKLKNINFTDINFKPSASWLLEKENFAKVANGEFDDMGKPANSLLSKGVTSEQIKELFGGNNDR